MRPEPDFHGFYGQRQIVNQLLYELKGAKQLGEACPDIGLMGGSGLGKTHLARALASEFGTQLHYVFSGRGMNPAKLAEMAPEWQPKDFVFFDEAHALDPTVQEATYRLMEKEPVAPRLVTGTRGRPVVDGTRSVARVTVVIATDRPAGLRRALTKRLGVTVTLTPYSEREMVYIIRARAAALGMVLSMQAPGIIAKACQGIPRNAGHRLESLRRFCAGVSPSQYGKKEVMACLRASGVDRFFRTPEQQDYMHRLRTMRNGRGIALKTVSGFMHLEPRHVESEIEPALFERGWVQITGTGRSLTAEGLRIVTEMESEASDV